MNEDKTSLLIVGLGSIGERHLRCFSRTGRVELGICDLDAGLRDEVGDRYGVRHRYGSLEAALGEGYDAVVVATPAHLHVVMASHVVGVGKHVLIEKPLSTSTCGVVQLAEQADRRHLVAAVAYVMRFHPALGAARRAILDGRFGKPLQLVAHCGQDFPFYRPAYRETYYSRHDTGGGAIQDALTHIVNAAEWIVGPVDRVMADAAHLSVPGVTVEDTVHMIARHGPVMASYALNQFQAPNESSITVACQRGTVRVELVDGAWAWQTDPDGEWQRETFPGMGRDDLFLAQANAFLDAIGGQATPLCSISEAGSTLEAGLAILAACDQPSWRSRAGNLDSALRARE